MVRLREIAAITAIGALVACSPAPSSTPVGSSAATSGTISTPVAKPTTASTTGSIASGTATGATTMSTPAASTGTTSMSTPSASTSTTGSTASSTPSGSTTTSGAATAGASVAGTATAAAPVRIMGAQLNPTDPTLTLQNTGSAAVDMTGWKLRVGGTAVNMPSNAKVGPNETVTIHVSQGTSSGKDVYLGSEAATLVTALRPGAKVAIENQTGSTVTEFALPA